MASPIITFEANMVADPELRFLQSGAPVANLRLAYTPRKFNRDTNEWEDGKTLFMRATAWNDLATGVSESLEKGMPVIGTGELVDASYTNREGVNVTAHEIRLTSIAPDLRRGTTSFTKNPPKNGGAGGGGQNRGGGGGYNQPQGQPQNQKQDPWSGGGNQGGYDDPPF